MGKIIIVSNRLPIKVKKAKDRLQFEHTVGGLASGLDAVQKAKKGAWIGWPGSFSKESDQKEEAEVRKELKSKFGYYPVFQSQKDIEKFYEGYSNSTLWPLFHYFPKNTTFDRTFWRAYVRVNKLYLEEILKVADEKDTIWVHDYHLMLLPRLLRERLPELSVGFFLHTPFPSFELFRLLPEREEILRGVLGADLIGFHTYDYTRHFLNSVYRILGLENNLGVINAGDRMIKADAFPIGIDYEKFYKAAERANVQKELKNLKKELGDKKVILSVDRLDYTKGIPERLAAFSEFLERYPDYKGKITLILVAVPSRTKIGEYQDLKKEVDELVGEINGRFGSLDWNPIWYLYKGLEFEQLAALYKAADICLVTPLRDGMNLIAKEYVATKEDGDGVLVLSEMAGSAEELSDALMVNPNNKDQMVEALKKALTISSEEKVKRIKLMQKELSSFDENHWVKSFLGQLLDIKQTQDEQKKKILTEENSAEITKKYKSSDKRLILLDYDGTLSSFVGLPDEAKPDEDLIHILKKMASDPKNEIVITSGRDKKTLESWFGDLDIGLIAEHGVWLKKGKTWQQVSKLSYDWKDDIRPILERYVERTPGSFIEEKDFSLVWHFRRVDPALVPIRSRELVSMLTNVTGSLNLQILEGNKVIEIKSADINKGIAASNWFSKDNKDFILALGDDTTDEDTFRLLPDSAFTIKVGLGLTEAKYNLKSINDVRPLIKSLLF